MRSALERAGWHPVYQARCLGQRLLASDDPPEPVAVPEALRGYEVETASTADYDRLLEAVTQ